MAGPIPLTVVGGFLGSGKTTLVNHILRNASGIRAAVVVNDFGAINIDRALVADAWGETIALTNGCVCCSIGGDLTDALIAIMSRAEAPDWIVIEASGVSDPWRIAQVGLADRGLLLDGVVVLADGACVRALAEDPRIRDTVLRQLDGADIVVLNKADLVGAAERAETRAWLTVQAPRATILEATSADLPIDLLTGVAIGRARRFRAAVHGDSDHARRFDSLALSFEGRFSAARLRELLGSMPAGILRVKGIVRTDESASATLQYAGRRGTLRAIDCAPFNISQVMAIALRGELPAEMLRCALDRALKEDVRDDRLGR